MILTKPKVDISKHVTNSFPPDSSSRRALVLFFSGLVRKNLILEFRLDVTGLKNNTDECAPGRKDEDSKHIQTKSDGKGEK